MFCDLESTIGKLFAVRNFSSYVRTRTFHWLRSRILPVYEGNSIVFSDLRGGKRLEGKQQAGNSSRSEESSPSQNLIIEIDPHLDVGPIQIHSRSSFHIACYVCEVRRRHHGSRSMLRRQRVCRHHRLAIGGIGCAPMWWW